MATYKLKEKCEGQCTKENVLSKIKGRIITLRRKNKNELRLRNANEKEFGSVKKIHDNRKSKNRESKKKIISER